MLNIAMLNTGQGLLRQILGRLTDYAAQTIVSMIIIAVVSSLTITDLWSSRTKFLDLLAYRAPVWLVVALSAAYLFGMYILLHSQARPPSQTTRKSPAKELSLLGVLRKSPAKELSHLGVLWPIVIYTDR